MVSVHIKDENSRADLTIDSQIGRIGITVVSDGKQLDFDMSFEEWELTTNFLNAQLNNQKSHSDNVT